mmetsp:Transcript_22196/g.32767  ORF Transcript_22196/g.32767 Transcript_22196/m.32767 type:complete len:453 (+) Transcript_22196:119-1477(+)
MLAAERTNSIRRKESTLWMYFLLLILAQLTVSFFLFYQQEEPVNDSTIVSSLSLSKVRSTYTSDGQKNKEITEISGKTENIQLNKNREVQTEHKIVLDNSIRDHDIHLDGKVDARETWERLEGLPTWVKEYFDWHEDQRKLINETNWKDFKYFVVQCVREDNHCGGASDRLKPLPFFLLMAYRYKRIFLIWWTRPFPLEEFLVPNAINWTVPEYLPLNVPHKNGKLMLHSNSILAWSKSNEIIVRSKLQSFEGGQLTYENITDSTYDQVFHDLFRLVFDPHPSIAKILREELAVSGLTPGHYAVAHYRAFYARASRKPERIMKMTLNAINCASQLRPGGPIYFASDSLLALATAREYAKNNLYSVVTIENQEPLHLDKAGNWSERKPSDFYSIFVDLYLMAMGRCLTFGQGGFGRFGLLLGYNATCTNRHTWNKHLVPCNWTDVPNLNLENK